VRAHAGALAPGGVVGDGRYRLLAQYGEDARVHTQLWRARDGQLNRDIALSVILGDAANTDAAAMARRTLDRATHAATFDHHALARVIDVLSLGSGIVPTEGVLGMIVADWSPGTDLVDLVADGPVPPGAAAALMEPLTAAVEQAHQYGVVLGVDHPQRIRVTPDGALRLAFPGALPQASLRDDVRGLGALLYLLLTGRWPLTGGPEAIPAAPTGPDGTLVAPKVLQPQTPIELSNLAVRCLADERNTVSGIRTPAAILAVLERVSDDQANTQIMHRVGPSRDEDDDHGSEVWTTKKPVRDPEARKRLAIAVGVLSVLTVGVLIWLAIGVVGFFSNSGSPSGPPQVTASMPTASNAPPTTTPKPTTPTNKPVKPDSVQVFNVSGDTDNPGTVDRVTDGDPGTEWKTQNYFQNFPSLKPGVGIMAKFPEASKFGQVNINSPSEGTHVEIRTADSANPNIDDTKVIGDADLANGQTQIKLAKHDPTKYILVWVTKLAQNGSGFESSIGEINFLSGN
jgi:cytoskeletal protein RodZ